MLPESRRGRQDPPGRAPGILLPRFSLPPGRREYGLASGRLGRSSRPGLGRRLCLHERGCDRRRDGAFGCLP